MSDLIIKHWCSFCKKKEAEGTLTGRDPNIGDELIELPACEDCVIRLFPQMVGHQLSLF